MKRYIFRRLLHAAALLVLVSLLSFALLQLAPGNYTDGMRLDPGVSGQTIAAWRSRYGLDRPLIAQYSSWLVSAARGEFGFSFGYGVPVGSLLWPRMKNTLLLTAAAAMMSWVVALLLGVGVAASRNRALDSMVQAALSVLHSIPDLLIALALLLIAVRSGKLPVGGMGGLSSSGSMLAGAADVAAHLALPVLALVLAALPVLARHVEAAVRESMDAPFVQAARGLGVPRRRLWFAYTLPAAANPLISLFGYSIGGLLSSSLLIEVIMGWPGLGPMLLEAIFSRDIQVVIGATLASALFLIAGNLIADFLIYAVDPRIRQENG
ncbi:MAG: ABC transporter permease [Acidobacteriia bacterium]|nr:ABC transporter permease [Terriglobia bacterium]